MAENKELKYNEPWILQRADPFVCKKDGWYYFTASIPSYDCIALRRSKTLNGLKDAEEVVVWKKHESGIMSKHIWAPELHYLFGKWYIYFAAGEAENIWNIRPYVLECQGDDPINDEWVERGKMQRADDDIFSFEEEPAWPHGKWKVRLSDAAAEAILTRRDTEKKLVSTRPGMIRLPDMVYEMEDAAPLGSKLEQNNWRMQLCEAKIKRTCRGVYFLAETRSLSDYDHMIHEEYEEKSVFRQPDQYETVFLQLTIMCSESSEKKQLAQLLASVCNEVLSTIFPYNKGQITACYRDEDSFLGIVPFVRYSQTKENMYQDAFVIDLIENQSEEGLAAALYKNSSLLFMLCREWLRRAVDDPKSNEAALVDYMMKAQQTQLMLPAASESAGQLAGLAKLLFGLLSE